ncbi:MAG: N-acetyl-gamma-glutamyl-phosphate reductase [Eggerthellaceae bacterium]|nr:N-acetyl-gamma-glutamyl-phosphate reductase [Eggerthellaceae bacterium]
MAIKAGVVGAAGFAGIEAVRLLTAHPDFDLCAITSTELAGTRLADAYPAFEGVSDLRFLAHDDPALNECDVVFLAVPHTAALAAAPRFIDRGIAVVDLSADFRLKDPAVYEKWYKVPHTQTGLLEQAAFGLPELFAEELARAARQREQGGVALVACAGCYPTATSLAAAPAIRAGFVRDDAPIVVDAVSGVTGAGKKATQRTHFCFADANVEAYGVGTHRHTPEIEQILGAPGRVVFTPHLAPLGRGLLSTVTLPLRDDAPSDVQAYIDEYRRAYAESPFVAVLDAGHQPRTASVAGTNRAHIGLAVSEPAHMLVATGAIDNLGKGAAGQAVQCANILFGLPQDAGLAGVSLSV